MGLINCAGRPGSRAHAKILRRVGALVASGVEAIPFAYCMVKGCPFLRKYERTIREAFPGLTLVRGSHPAPPTEVEAPLLDAIGQWMVAPRKRTPETGRALRQAMAQADAAK